MCVYMWLSLLCTYDMSKVVSVCVSVVIVAMFCVCVYVVIVAMLRRGSHTPSCWVGGFRAIRTSFLSVILLHHGVHLAQIELYQRDLLDGTYGLPLGLV